MKMPAPQTPGGFVVSLHDVAPATAETCRRWIEILESRGIRTSLLVVPGPWRGHSLDSSPEFVSWLGDIGAFGHEYVQHGYSHTCTDSSGAPIARRFVGRMLARGCEEFWHLSFAEATRTLSLGRDCMEEHGIHVNGFVAPGWLMSKDSLAAARSLGFSYTCTHTRLIDLERGASLFSPTTSQRPNSWTSTFGAALNHLIVGVTTRTAPLVRIAIHPDDLGEPGLRDANLAMCDRLLARGFNSLTYGEAVQFVHDPGATV